MKKVVFLLLVFLPFTTPAQQQGQGLIDSLRHELPRAGNDTNKVNLVFDIAYAYYAIDADSSYDYAGVGLKLARQLDWETGIGHAHYISGIACIAKSQYPEALDNLFRALKIFEAAGDKQKKLLGRTYDGIGTVYMQTNFLPKALEYQLSALKIRQELKDTSSIAGSMSNIGNVYYMQLDYPMALDYYTGALKLFNKLNETNGIANCLVNIGCVYQQEKKPEKAIDNYSRALRLYESSDNKSGVATSFGNIGEAYLTMAEDTGSCKAGNNILLNNYTGNLNNAILYLNKAIAISKENELLDNISEFSQHLSRAYQLSGNYKASLETYKQYATIKDSIQSNSSKIKIANLETERNIDKQRTQIALNKAALEQKQTETKLYITGIALLIVVIAFGGRKFIEQLRSNKILSRERKKAMDRVAAQSNILTNISHTQAHDVRGPITTILGLVSVFNHDDPADPMNKELLDNITEVTLRLDKTVQDIVRQENKLSHETDSE